MTSDVQWQNAGKSGLDQWNFTLLPTSSSQVGPRCFSSLSTWTCEAEADRLCVSCRTPTAAMWRSGCQRSPSCRRSTSTSLGWHLMRLGRLPASS